MQISSKKSANTSTTLAAVIRTIILAAGILLLLNALYMFAVSNFNLGILVQGFVAIDLIVYALVFRKLPRWIHGIAGTLFFITAVLVAFLFLYGTTNTATYNEDVVLVLGAGIRGETVTSPLARRLQTAIKYHGQNPDALIVVCGGQGLQEDIPEALAMERYLVERGIPSEAIIKEDQSTSTFENVAFARGILESRFPQGFSSVLITNDFHIYRATRIASYAGVEVSHIGASTKWHTLPSNYLREMLAVMWMWVSPPA